MKRAIYAIIAMVLCVCMFSACGSSGEETTKPSYDLGEISDSGEHGENIKWEYYADTQTLVLSGKGEMTEGKRTDYPWFKYAENIKAVYIKSGVTNIANSSFSSDSVKPEYKNLETIYLPETLTEIGNYAFDGAVRLKDVTIPRGVVKIGENAFADCLSLGNIMLPKTLLEVGEDAFRSCRDFHVYYEGTSDLFYEIDRNGELNMQDYYCHFESKGIDTREVEGKVAFEPEGDIGTVTETGKCGDDARIDDLTWEFYEASGTLVIKGTGYMDWYNQNSNDELYYDAPWGAQKSRNFTGRNRIEIHREAFPYKQVYVMDGVNSVGAGAFTSRETLEIAKISGSVKAIYRDAFKGCDNLSEIIISKGIEEIHSDAIPSNATIKYTGSEEDWTKIFGSNEVQAKEIIFNYK